MNFTLKLLLILILGLWSCGDEQKTTADKAEDIKKDSCEGISLLKIVEKALFKNLKEFVLDSTFNFQIDDKKKFSQLEFNCLKINEVTIKDFYDKGEKEVFGIFDTLSYGNNKYFLYNNHFDKNGKLKFFTTYSMLEEGGGHSLSIFTISPESKKIKDVYKIAYGIGDMGFVRNRSCEFLNDSVFVQNEYAFAQNELTKNIKKYTYRATSKFLINKVGEIKLLEHKVLINKEVK